MRKILLFVLALIMAASISAQGEKLRGKALYDAWQKLEIVKTTGLTRVTWLPNGKGYLESESSAKGSTFFRVDPKTGKRAPLWDPATIKNMLDEYARLSGKRPEAMPFSSFTYEEGERTIRFSAYSLDYVYFFSTGKMIQLQKLIGPASITEDAEWLRMGKYSPDYSRFLYGRKWDLRLFDTSTGAEEPLTTGGSEEVRNGCLDWVYPEELDQREAFWWSPDGKSVAYLQFDERGVYNFPLVHDLEPARAPTFASTIELERYPKAGKPNPVVRLFVVDLASKKPKEVETGASADTYLTRIAWRRDGSEVFFQRLNRFQNRLELLAANPRTGAVRTVLTEEEPCYVNLHDDFIQLADGRRFIWSSERSGWKHLCLYDLSGKLITPLTRGEWEVAAVSTVDEAGGWVYFTIADNVGLDTHFGRVRLNGKGLARLTRQPGTHRVSIDPAGKYYTDYFSSLTVPPTVTIHAADGNVLRTLATSKIDKVTELGLQEPELVALKAADGKTEVFGVLFKPADFDPAKKYPLLVQVYGGPSHSNSNSYQTGGFKAQQAQLGFLVWELDGRGTLRRGKRFLTETYLKFGQVEVDDQAAAVRQLRERPYVDGGRVGMTGGSYGGYTTCMSLLRYPDVYSVGVAAAPVTDWRSYDSIYTERYMRTPEANPEGYEKGSALAYAKGLKGKLLLVHGSIDNNVHPANTLHLAELLQKEGKPFDLMIYPEHRHGIRGTSAGHLNKLRLDYFLRHLRPEGWEESLKTLW